MSVAKSYEKYELLGEPYERDNKEYIQIKYTCCRKPTCSKCGGQGFYPKEVRWYKEPIQFDARKGFGFNDVGRITLICGPADELEHHFLEVAPRTARYNLIFNWFIPSWLPVPTNLPKCASAIELYWDEVSENDKIFSYDKVKSIVAAKVSGGVETFYVGQVNDKIHKDFVLIKVILHKDYFGEKYTYIFQDEDNNYFRWTTAARKLEEGEIYNLKGTIKEHLQLDGIKYTVLTRCREG